MQPVKYWACILSRQNACWASIEEELAGMTEALTQFGRMLEELGATQIPAYSPQATGRIERLWGTLQRRLIIEMRLANIFALPGLLNVSTNASRSNLLTPSQITCP
jgi:hypothetical protein